MVCKFLKKVLRTDRSWHPSSTPSDVPNPSNFVITNSTINVVGRNQHHSGPIPGSNARVPGTPAAVDLDGYYTVMGNPVPYLHVYPGPVYGVPVLLSPVIFMNVSGQPVLQSSPSYGNQAQHQVSPLNNRSAFSDGRGDPNQHAGQTHALGGLSAHVEHHVHVPQPTHLDRIPSCRPITSNCDCCSRQYNPTTLPDFVIGSSTGQTMDRQVTSYETNLTAHRQSCVHASSPTHLPHLPHDRSHPTNEVDHSFSVVLPSSPTSSTSDSSACREHASRGGTSAINYDEMALNSCRFGESSDCVRSVGTSKVHHTVSPKYRSRLRSLGSLPTPPTVPELTRSPSLPVIIPPTIDGHPESRPSSPHPVP